MDTNEKVELVLIGESRWLETIRGRIVDSDLEVAVVEVNSLVELGARARAPALALVFDNLPRYDSSSALEILKARGTRTIVCGASTTERLQEVSRLKPDVILSCPTDVALLSNLSVQLEEWRKEAAGVKREFLDFIAASEFVGEGIEITDQQGKILYVNKAFEELSGYSKAQAIGTKAEDLFCNELCPAEVYAELWKIIEGGNEWRGRLISRGGDGTLFHQAATISPVLNASNELRYTVALRRDITQQVNSEEALLISEERYRLLAENATDIIWTVGLDGWITYCSPSVRRVLGYSLREAMQWSIEDVLPSEYLGELFTDLLDGEVGKNEIHGLDLPRAFEVSQTGKDGRELWCEVLVDYLRGGCGQIVGLLGVSRDISARREVERDRASLVAQLQQSQKMEAIGKLAGGIAHDFNNLLTSIMVSAQLLLKESSQASNFRSDILEIKEAASRATDLTKQLLTFSRRQVIAPKALDVNLTLSTSLRMVQRLIHENISLGFNPDRERKLVIAIDPIQLEQILVNLVVNSCDAMPKGGEITVETNVRYYAESECRPFLGLGPGTYISVSVTDTGQGMNDETKVRLFEPFFTTKPPGKGTGLGLSTVYGIVKQNGGGIDVKSSLGKGTRVAIFFPEVSQKLERMESCSEKRLQKKTGQKVLVVEDQEVVRNVTRRILEHGGFEVLEAANGREALLNGGDQNVLPDLLLTDVVMPEIAGRELAETLRERRPDLRVLFMSGYTEDHLDKADLQEPLTAFIQKPFTVNALLGAVQNLLEERFIQ